MVKKMGPANGWWLQWATCKNNVNQTRHFHIYAEMKIWLPYWPYWMALHQFSKDPSSSHPKYTTKKWCQPDKAFLCPQIKVLGALCRHRCVDVGVHKHFGFCQITWEPFRHLTWIFLWLLSTRGRFLSIMAAAWHPRWRLSDSHIEFGFRQITREPCRHLTSNFFDGCSLWEEGSFRWWSPADIQDGSCGSHIEFGFHQITWEYPWVSSFL